MEIGLLTSEVLSTLPKPTFDGLIPLATLASVIASLAIFAVEIAPVATSGEFAVPDKSPVN